MGLVAPLRKLRMSLTLQACDKIPPVLGKKKVKMLDDSGQGFKLCGRNELIEERIFRLTGVRRVRKQLSSHIQVIKKTFNKGDDRKFMDSIG